MTLSTRDFRPPAWLVAISIPLLALAASIAILPNTWVQDDLPIIKASTVLHSLAHPARFFTQSWWPDPYPRELYRPLTSTWLALQWSVANGNPIVFRLVSVLLYMAGCWAVYRLARRIVSPGVAWCAAACFAVHPVHVEAVAIAVNQAELIVGLLLVLLVTLYIDRRRDGTLSPRWVLAIAGGYLAVSLFKENGLILPGLFAIAELFIIRDPRNWRARLTELRPLILALVLVAVAVLGARDLALAGNTKGTFTAEALVGLTFTQRAMTMLAVVPQWLRLFFWPDHLRADYSPQEIVGAMRWGWGQTVGLVVLIAAGWVVWRGLRPEARGQRPEGASADADASNHASGLGPRASGLAVVPFAISGTAIALFPVSNILVPTGIVMAERTLFTPSVGMMIAASAALAGIGAWAFARGAAPRVVATLAVIAVLGMGLTRSISRDGVWRDQPTLWFQTVLDAPNSYRAHHAYAQILFEAKSEQSAEEHYRRAMQLYPPAWPVALDLADKYRLHGSCFPAIKLYHAVLSLTPDHAAARASLVACLLYIADYPAAAREARLGESYGRQPKTFALYARVADSAAAAHAPEHTVKLPPPVAGDSTP